MPSTFYNARDLPGGTGSGVGSRVCKPTRSKKDDFYAKGFDCAKYPGSQ